MRPRITLINRNRPLSNINPVEEQFAEIGRRMDNIEVNLMADASRRAILSHTHVRPLNLPSVVDHSLHLKFIRDQGAFACGLNAAAACWDILLSKYCAPYIHPNISVNRMIWAWAWTLRCWPENLPCNQRTTMPIPGLPGSGNTNYQTLDEYLHFAGCPTEGTELTNSDAVQWPTDDGNAECPNFRLDRHPEAVAPNFHRDVQVNLNELKYWLNGGPVRVGIWGNHFVTLVGYNDTEQRFKFINSWGDNWGDNGFGYVAYSNINQELDSAQVYQYVPPQAVPCARIRFTSQWRQDVNLWLGVEGTQQVKRIWPSGQRQDSSKNLWFTVKLPTGFVWPPSPQNRIFLDVYDSGSHSHAGGAIQEFSVHYGDQHRFCNEILQGIPDPDNHSSDSGVVPRLFTPRQLLHLTIQ